MCSVPTARRPVRRFNWRGLPGVSVVVTDPDVTKPRSGAPVGSNKARDWVRRPIGVLFWWALPLALGVSTNFWHLPLARTALMWTIALAWMGTGCALNALRCGRRHCFISAPALWLGAIAAAAVSLGFLSRPSALGEAVNGALALAALSFLSEQFWGRYVRTSAPATGRTRPPPAR